MLILVNYKVEKLILKEFYWSCKLDLWYNCLVLNLKIRSCKRLLGM